MQLVEDVKLRETNRQLHILLVLPVEFSARPRHEGPVPAAIFEERLIFQQEKGSELRCHTRPSLSRAALSLHPSPGHPAYWLWGT